MADRRKNKQIQGIIPCRIILEEVPLLKKYLSHQGRLNPDFRQLQELIQELNQNPAFSGKQLQPGELNGMLLITQAINLVQETYFEQSQPDALPQLRDLLNRNLKQTNILKLLTDLSRQFNLNLPSPINAAQDLPGLLPELVTLWLNQQNKAFSPWRFLIQDKRLFTQPQISKFYQIISRYFRTQPPLKSDLDLISFLQEPARLFPDSIAQQLDYIIQNWADLLGDFLESLLSARDLIREEQKFHLLGPGPVHIYDFSGSDYEYEKFTEDSDWMPHLVLIAKSTYVWLDQLSQKYGRDIHSFDQIPDDELYTLARRGFTGIWLIGVWERSPASQRIKHLTGNYDSIASAYSLLDYRMAATLGGEPAMQNLQQRAWKFGIRIACDMVPNHTGLDSDWIVEHPEWFLQLPHPPYPSYSFTGENLSGRPEIEIYLEDHYYSKTDAAVVFKLYDRRTQSARYIYHGNDGTSIPWNDTAQLNYLLPEVREAVISKIISIARQFPVIRFDAAMTLAKKHIQRLWFPEPGQGGDIPSRSQFSLTRAEFNRLLPQEFWREVVDRIAEEAPDTLLLAEAFWMMEGYFVRTLGMHRVYNSAFMNMLKNEDNAKYRKSIYNIIEFNPEILKRFVNFMSNPDEDTAIGQFGKDDKYFGVCVLMATMPGLPMFAHGQIEGFTEKYGMEFPRAKWNEREDQYLVERHEKEVFPLLKKRIIFSEVVNFLLYDFDSDWGYVNENVFAYSNENQGRLSLVVFNNKFEQASGRIHWANTSRQTNGSAEWYRVNLGSALHLHDDPNRFAIFRDAITSLEYIRNSAEIHAQGLHQDLGAFKYAVYLDFQEVEDQEDGRYRTLSAWLQGGGVPDINLSLRRLQLNDLLNAFTAFYNYKIVHHLIFLKLESEILSKQFQSELEFRLASFLQELELETGWQADSQKIADKLTIELSHWLKIPGRMNTTVNWEELMEVSWIWLRHLRFFDDNKQELLTGTWWDELLLGDAISWEISLDDTELTAEEFQTLLRFSLQNSPVPTGKNSPGLKTVVSQWLNDRNVQSFLGINRYQNVLWFNRERWQLLVKTFALINRLDLELEILRTSSKLTARKRNLTRMINLLKKADVQAEYQVNRLLAIL